MIDEDKKFVRSIYKRARCSCICTQAGLSVIERPYYISYVENGRKRAITHLWGTTMDEAWWLATYDIKRKMLLKLES